MVTASPVWVKIEDFKLAKLAGEGTAFRTQAFTVGYFAPEAGIATSGDSSEYTNAVDIWAVGCIAHEMLTQVLPFRTLFELSLYCNRPEFPRNYMLLKNISREGMEIVESMLAIHPGRRIAAKEALASEWLRQREEGLETEEGSARPGLLEAPVPSGGGEAANEESLPGNSKEGFHNRAAITVGAKGRRTTEVLLLRLRHRLQVGFLGKHPIEEVGYVLLGIPTAKTDANYISLVGDVRNGQAFRLEFLGHISGEAMRIGRQAANDLVRHADVEVLIQTTKITQVLGAIIQLPSVPRDEEYQFRRRSIDLLRKWKEPSGPRASDKNQAPTPASFTVKSEKRNPSGSISAEAPSTSPAIRSGSMDQKELISAQKTKSLAANEPENRVRISVGGNAEETSLTWRWYPDAFRSPKPHANIDADIKRVHDEKYVPASANPRGWSMDITADAIWLWRGNGCVFVLSRKFALFLPLFFFLFQRDSHWTDRRLC